MNCPKCSTDNTENAQFCANCGEKMPVEAPNLENGPVKTVFYSMGWPRAKTLALAVVPQFDLMADEKNFYVLKLPPSYAPVWGFFIGYLLLKVIGLLIGVVIGEAIANARRKSARATWIDDKSNLLSSQYEKYVFLKIPIEDLKHHLSFEKGKYLVIKYSDGVLTLRGSKEKYVAAEDHLKKYVLQ